jgi:dCMP deaminase
MKLNKWNYRFMEVADLQVAQWSKDRSSKVGALIVRDREIVVTGYNGFPREIDDDVEERHERPEKYQWVIHAETNAIINAARQGKSTLGTDMYVNWYVCDRCAGNIVNAGIKRLFCDVEPDWDDPRSESFGFLRARDILKEGGVEVYFLDYEAHRKGLDY